MLLARVAAFVSLTEKTVTEADTCMTVPRTLSLAPRTEMLEARAAMFV